MKLLLHTCCAPCLIYPLERLAEKGFAVTGLFYNPNIHPYSEYDRRKQAVEEFSKSLDINVEFPEYLPDEFFRAVNPVRELHSLMGCADLSAQAGGGIKAPSALSGADFSNGVNLKESTPGRCSLCWLLRLKVTAQLAKQNGFDGFSTTLLVSPYQEQELLHKIGADIARDEGIDFYYEDFRPGFRKAHNTAKEKGIYCQKYCGCIYSEIERDKRA